MTYTLENPSQSTSPIGSEINNLGSRLAVLAESVDILEKRLISVCSQSGTAPSDLMSIEAEKEMYASPMKDRLSNYLAQLNGSIYKINSLIASLEI
jgi:hypothetical protein